MRLTEYQVTEGGIPFIDVDSTQEELRRLAQYEDIGTPEEFAELKKAQNEGRLVELPCKPNDIYWHRNYDTGGPELNIALHDIRDPSPEYREIDACAWWE